MIVEVEPALRGELQVTHHQRYVVPAGRQGGDCGGVGIVGVGVVEEEPGQPVVHVVGRLVQRVVVVPERARGLLVRVDVGLLRADRSEVLGVPVVERLRRRAVQVGGVGVSLRQGVDVLDDGDRAVPGLPDRRARDHAVEGEQAARREGLGKDLELLLELRQLEVGPTVAPEDAGQHRGYRQRLAEVRELRRVGRRVPVDHASGRSLQADALGGAGESAQERRCRECAAPGQTQAEQLATCEPGRAFQIGRMVWVHRLSSSTLGSGVLFGCFQASV